MGNDNPIRNDKLLREAYQAGRRAALNEEMGGGASMQRMPMTGMGMGRNMGMGQMVGKDLPDIRGAENPGSIPTRIEEMLPNFGNGYDVVPASGGNPAYIVNPRGVPVFYYDTGTGRWEPVTM
jgi:hypothetical protein